MFHKLGNEGHGVKCIFCLLSAGHISLIQYVKSHMSHITEVASVIPRKWS